MTPAEMIEALAAGRCVYYAKDAFEETMGRELAYIRRELRARGVGIPEWPLYTPTGSHLILEPHAEGTHPTCNICRRPLNQPFKRDTIDCGGDCLRCMAEAGDPACIEDMREVEPNNPRWADPDADSSPGAPQPVAD